MLNNDKKDWDLVIKSEVGLFDLQLKKIWQYRDLLWMLIKRDFVAFYKQTILGPIWFVIQPIFTIAVYVFLFGSIANISTGEIPMPLFYLSGIMAWTYFAETMLKTSNVFRDKSAIFSKVYFPRLIIPLSIISSNLIKLIIHLVLLFIIIAYYNFNGGAINFTPYMLLTPFFIIMMAVFAMGLGLIVSSVTTKYRDFALLLSFATSLLMYTCPVVYPLFRLDDQIRMIVNLNPMTTIIEGLRFCFFQNGDFTVYGLVYTIIIILLTFIGGLLVFNKVEKNFIDTI